MAAPAPNRATPAPSKRRWRRLRTFVKAESDIRPNLSSRVYYNYSAGYHVNISVNTELTPGRLYGLARKRHHHRCARPARRSLDGRGGGDRLYRPALPGGCGRLRRRARRRPRHPRDRPPAAGNPGGAGASRPPRRRQRLRSGRRRRRHALAGGARGGAPGARRGRGGRRRGPPPPPAARPRGEAGRFADTLEALRSRPAFAPFGAEPNSTIGVVATNAALTKSDCYRLAVMAQAGLARTIRPVYTPVDGDTIFALATGAAGGPAGVPGR